MNEKIRWLCLVGALLAGVTAMDVQGAAGAGTEPLSELRGRVTDEGGNPLAGAEVSLVELNRRTASGADGGFVFRDLPQGRYTVVVRRLGYGSSVQQTRVEDGSFLEVVLRETPLRLSAITVTAARSPVQAMRSPASATTLEGDRLARSASASLVDQLQVLPGVRNLSTGSQVGKPVIRGLTGARVLVLDDGLRVEDYSWGDEHGPAVEPRLAQRVEVIRGPASVLYGADALGGVVNVVPDKLPEAVDGARVVRTASEVYGGTNNREVGGALRAEGAAGVFGWRALGIGRRAGDLRTPDGRLNNTGFDALTGELAVGMRGRWGDVTVRYQRYGTDLELLEAELEEAGNDVGPDAVTWDIEEVLQRLRDDRVQLTATFPVGNMRLEPKLQWQRNWRREFEEDDDEAEIDLVLNTFSLDLLGHASPGERVDVTVGVSGLLQDNNTRGESAIVPGARTSGLALFAVQQARLGPWTVAAGGRFDVRWLDVDPNDELEVAGDSRDYRTASGNVGAVYRMADDVALVANLARGWRAPSLFELYTFGPHPGQLRFEIGDPDLGPETSVNLDLGVRWERRYFRGELTGYQNRIRDFIWIAPTGEFREGYRVYRYGQSDAQLRGAEGSAEVHPWHPLALRMRLDLVRAENRETGEPLPLIPPARLDLAVELHSDELGWADRTYLSVETELVARQTRRTEFDVPTAGYGLLHLGAGIERMVADRSFRIDLRVRNAADRRYADYLSRYKEFAPNPGRNVALRVGLGW